MGHANRPRQLYSIGLDTQPWCLCLSFDRRSDPNSNSHTFGKCDANSLAKCDTIGDANRDTNTIGDS